VPGRDLSASDLRWQLGRSLPFEIRNLIVGVILVALGACTTPASEMMPEPTQQGVVGDNKLGYNRLALNRLALNRLALNRLALNRLSAARLSLTTSTTLAQTADGREVLKYVAQCALKEGDVLVAEYQGVVYEFPGLLGLAPHWESSPLTTGDQHRLSACLIAHVNAFGVSVPISLRAAAVLPSTTEERLQYAVYEGTFFGQVFDGGELKTYACQGHAGLGARAHSEDRALRVCTDTTGECQIVSVGRCRDVCEQRFEDEGWQNCRANGVVYPETVSVYLFADDPDGMNQLCTGTGCEMSSATGTAAMLDCVGSDTCGAACDSEATCAIDGTMTNNFVARVGAARFSEIDCYGNNNCSVDCSEGASCEVDCTNTSDCAVTCAAGSMCDIECGGTGENCSEIACGEGSSCRIECGGAANCGFSQCDVGAVTCPGGIIVCGRPCP
jgi:hypothetical protein